MEQIPEECSWLVGIDEVGRGPIAGPVTIGACACARSDYDRLRLAWPEITDSKVLTATKREAFSQELWACSELRIATASTTAQTIDKIGITKSLRLAVARALASLGVDSGQAYVMLDGRLYAPARYQRQITIIRGDATEWLIGGASIVAKVYRDAKMTQFDQRYRGYGLAQHKGYGTKQHYQALARLGPTPLHRRSFLRNWRPD